VAHRLTFEGCFDKRKLRALIVTLPLTYAVLNSMVSKPVKWPSQVRCMTDSKIRAGRKRGAGHGYTYTSGPRRNTIWLNHYMTEAGYWLVFTHENLHHAFPDASEDEINCSQLPYVFEEVFGRKWPGHEWARSQGVGSPQPGTGDRSYCR